jgi:hypothetical protein
MKDLTYVGPHDAVDVDLPIDSEAKTQMVTVANGETHSFADADAKRLLEQPTNWELAKGGKAEKTPGKTGEKE